MSVPDEFLSAQVHDLTALLREATNCKCLPPANIWAVKIAEYLSVGSPKRINTGLDQQSRASDDSTTRQQDVDQRANLRQYTEMSIVTVKEQVIDITRPVCIRSRTFVRLDYRSRRRKIECRLHGVRLRSLTLNLSTRARVLDMEPR